MTSWHLEHIPTDQVRDVSKLDFTLLFFLYHYCPFRIFPHCPVTPNHHTPLPSKATCKVQSPKRCFNLLDTSLKPLLLTLTRQRNHIQQKFQDITSNLSISKINQKSQKPHNLTVIYTSYPLVTPHENSKLLRGRIELFRSCMKNMIWHRHN